MDAYDWGSAEVDSLPGFSFEIYGPTASFGRRAFGQIAPMAAFLATDASYVTGQVIFVDGGGPGG